MWIAMFVAGGLMLGQADGPADAELKLKVRRLARQLDASRLADREAAEQDLIELGAPILDLLPAPSDRLSAEVAQRIARIRQKLQEAMAASVGKASTVTLDGEFPLSEIFAKIESQTGNKVELRRKPRDTAGEPKVRVDFDAVPFWPALDDLLDQTRLTVYPYAEKKLVSLVPGDGDILRGARASYAGPFRLEPIAIRAERDLRDPTNQSLQLVLEIAWEPRLSPVTLQQKMIDVEAADEQGNRLAVDLRDAVLEASILPDTTAVTLEIPLVLPERSVGRIASLRGKLIALLPGTEQTFRFTDLEKANEVEKRIAGVRVMLERVRKNRQVWEVRVRVRFDEASGALESHRNWIYDNKAFLESPDGKKIEWGTFETTVQTENEVGVAYYFHVEGSLAGHALSYKTPGLILSSEFDYELTDVPLP